MVCINIGRTFKLWAVYTALLSSQWLNPDKNSLFECNARITWWRVVRD